MAKEPAFICPSWIAGQRCKRYFVQDWVSRAIFTILGVGIALAGPITNFATAYSAAPPTAPLVIPILGWGLALLFTAIGSIILTLRHEIDAWGCLVAGIGTPTLLVIIMTSLLPHL